MIFQFDFFRKGESFILALFVFQPQIPVYLLKNIKQSIKLFAFTTEIQRSRREGFFVCRGGARQTKRGFCLE
jgi:hypothetical protein